MRRGHTGRTDTNHGEIVTALRSVSGVKVNSLAGVGCGCPYLLIGARGLSYLVEVKNPNKLNGNRLLNPDQQKWIREWTGSPVVILLDAGKAKSWARRIAAAPSTFAGVLDGLMTFNRSATRYRITSMRGVAASPDCSRSPYKPTPQE